MNTELCPSQLKEGDTSDPECGDGADPPPQLESDPPLSRKLELNTAVPFATEVEAIGPRVPQKAPEAAVPFASHTHTASGSASVEVGVRLLAQSGGTL